MKVYQIINLEQNISVNNQKHSIQESISQD